VSQVTIYHNPRCSKSRQTLDLLRQRGIEPEIIDYLKTPPSADTLRDLLQLLRIAPMDLIRRKESEFAEAGLDGAQISDDEIIQAMILYPRLIERPIVVANGRAAIGRPPERVLDIL
jgi:arsenate reductase